MAKQTHEKMPTSFIMREMQVKTTMIYQLTPVRMGKIKPIRNKCWQGCGEKRNPLALLMGMQTGTVTVEENMVLPQKVKIELPYDPVITLLGIYHPNTKTLTQGIHTPLVYCSFIYNSQIMEAAQVSISR